MEIMSLLHYLLNKETMSPSAMGTRSYEVLFSVSMEIFWNAINKIKEYITEEAQILNDEID